MSKATQIVHWPGKDVYACDAHAAQLKAVSSIMGCPVSTSTILTAEECEGPECMNCVNKAKADGGQQ